jgi:hypothetical protein
MFLFCLSMSSSIEMKKLEIAYKFFLLWAIKMVFISTKTLSVEHESKNAESSSSSNLKQK